MGPRRRPAAAQVAVERARNAQLVAASTVQTFGLSVLESAAIRPNTQRQYHNRLATLALFCRTYRLDWDSWESLDSAVTALLNYQFLDGKCSDLGTQLIAALSHVYPSLARRSGLYLPRACRAAGAWKRRAPGRSRLPMPKTGAAAIAGVMLYNGRRRMAIYTMLTFICYLRPLEGIALLGRHLVAPVSAAGPSYASWGLLLHDFDLGQPSKTGTTDDAVLIDLDSWILPTLEGLQAATHADASLWDFDATEFRLTFKAAADLLGLGQLAPHPYSLRHGGASDDLLTRRRSLEQVQARGRWVSASSLRRYTKATRLLRELQEVHSDVFSFGDFVMNQFTALVEHGLTGPLFDQAPASVRALLTASPTAGVTSAGGRKRRRPAA